MKTSDFDYNLPEELIAREPVKPRDKSRLLVLDRDSGKIEHRVFVDILEYLEPNDLLILNNSKVYPARLLGSRKETGGNVEVFLLRNTEGNIWECMLGGKRMKEGLVIEFSKKLFCELVRTKDNLWEVEFNLEKKDLMKELQKIGYIPLPPYIKRSANKKQEKEDVKNYQTVFASNEKLGSVAAPTAGLHFTKSLLKKIKEKGVGIEEITLHVGMGTFAPVKVDDPRKHKMHSEWVEIDKETMANIYLAKQKGKRIITVGTTSARSLEAIVSKFPISNFQFPVNDQFVKTEFQKQFPGFKNFVNIFIYPGYKFGVVDAMITNFHLPKSTLLMLVSALAGKKNIDKAYKEAIENNYRFYSYGDAMFIK